MTRAGLELDSCCSASCPCHKSSCCAGETCNGVWCCVDGGGVDSVGGGCWTGILLCTGRCNGGDGCGNEGSGGGGAICRAVAGACVSACM